MMISDDGIKQAQTLETFRADAMVVRGAYVIGFGHTATARPGQKISRDAARALLRADLTALSGAVAALLPRQIASVEFDKLVLYAWRIGVAAFRNSPALRAILDGRVAVPKKSYEALKRTPGSPPPKPGGDPESPDEIIGNIER